MAGSKPRATFPPERLASYERLVAALPGVERKGATLPYTAVNGHMFSYLDGAGTVALRLAEADRQAFMQRYGASLQVAHGVTQKEYVAVPEALLDQAAELAPWLRASREYVAGLKPKPATKVKRASR
jgi:TfoX/Sxy family transcriptional regulator of competence genes